MGEVGCGGLGGMIWGRVEGSGGWHVANAHVGMHAYGQERRPKSHQLDKSLKGAVGSGLGRELLQQRKVHLAHGRGHAGE